MFSQAVAVIPSLTTRLLGLYGTNVAIRTNEHITYRYAVSAAYRRWRWPADCARHTRCIYSRESQKCQKNNVAYRPYHLYISLF